MLHVSLCCPRLVELLNSTIVRRTEWIIDLFVEHLKETSSAHFCRDIPSPPVPSTYVRYLRD
jgi:hypothetical protein